MTVSAARLRAVSQYLTSLQKALGQEFANIEGAKLVNSNWRSQLGSGKGLRLEDGNVFERAGINYSSVGGDSLPPAASAKRPKLAGRRYDAVGVSVVAHPRNPFCPTAHLNVRFFCAGDVWWFGGGMDLTPHYGYAEDCRHFHLACRSALDKFDAALYPAFKKQCDEYFYIRHRGEMRGCGGIFFDDFSQGGFDNAFSVMRSVGDSFVHAYLPLIQKRKDINYGQREELWRDERRGRYVEFNLVYDRGTLFGLQSGGRADAVLMSLPPSSRWRSLSTDNEAHKKLRPFLRPKKWA